MSDLIKREDAIEALQKEINKGIPPFDDTMGAIRCGVRLARNIIEDLPSADRPQGEWIKDNLGTVICSECKRPRRDNRINHINFCNSCGARMKGVDDEAD